MDQPAEHVWIEAAQVREGRQTMRLRLRIAASFLLRRTDEERLSERRHDEGDSVILLKCSGRASDRSSPAADHGAPRTQ